MGVVAGFGTLIFGGASVGTAIAVGVAVDYGIDLLEDALVPDIPNTADTMGGRNVTAKNSTAMRDVVYGKVRKGGTIVYQETIGTNNEILHEVIVFATGACEQIEDLKFGDKLVWYYAGGGGNYIQTQNLTVQWRNGDHTTYTPLAGSTRWTANHKLSGMAYLTLSYNFDVGDYPTGKPKVTAVVKGRKIYDPRESSHSATNPSTWEWSSNPVLCLYDYLTDTDYGAGLDRSLFDESEIESEADYCDESIIIQFQSQPRYECHGVIKTNASIRDNIKNLLSCMQGKLLFVDGKFKILPLRSISTHPTTLTEDMIVGDFSMSHSIPRQSQYNVVKGEFVNAESRYTKTEYPQQTDSSYVSDDKEKLVKSFNLPFTTNWVRAQQLANVELRKSRRRKQLKVTVNAHGFNYAVNDVIEVSNDTLGITSQLFQITSMRINPSIDGITCDIEALEYDSNLHVLETGTEVAFTQSTIALPKFSQIAAPTNLRFWWRPNYTAQGEATVGVFLAWNAPVGVNVDHYEVSARDENDGYYISEKFTTNNTYFNIPHLTETGKKAYLRVTAVNRYGTKEYAQIRTVPLIPTDMGKVIRNSYVVGNPNVAPTEEQWRDHFSRDPVAGDILTVVSKVNGVITDSKAYVYVEEDQIIISKGTGANHRMPSKGDSATATHNMLLTIEDATSVTWSQSVLSYESNDGSTSMYNMQFPPYNVFGVTKGLKIQSSLPASEYNSRTTSESVLINKAVVRVTAAWTSTRTGASYNVSKDIDVVINVLNMQD